MRNPLKVWALGLAAFASAAPGAWAVQTNHAPELNAALNLEHRANLPFQTTPIPAPDLSRLVVYPNPYCAKKIQGSTVKFIHLPDLATLRLYSLDGCLVRTLRNQPGVADVAWDLKNEQGIDVASGTYLYLLRSGRMERRGKLALIR